MESLERFAAIRAAIEQGAERDPALRGAGLSPADWIRLQRHWLGALAAEIAGGGDTLARRYWRAYQAALPAPAAAESAPAAPVDPPPASVVLQKPTFLEAARAPAPAFDLRGTVVTFEAPASSALPFRDDVPARAAAPPAKQPDAGPRLSTGTAISYEPPPAPVTPFGGGAQPVKAPLAVTALSTDAPSGPATPFQVPEPEALGFSLTRYAELVAARDEPSADRAAVLAQFGLDEAGHAQVDGYWQKTISTSIVHAGNFVLLREEARKAVAARRETARKPASIGTGTVLSLAPAPVAIPARAAHPAPGPAAPLATTAVSPAAPGGGSAAGRPELSVEQYAWLVATLRRTAPDALPATLERLRLTPETRRELEERWARRMAADGALRETFLAALQRHLAGAR